MDLSQASLDLHAGLSGLDDFEAWPDALRDMLGRYVHHDWSVLFLVNKRQLEGPLLTNSGLGFDYETIFHEIAAYDMYAQTIYSQVQSGFEQSLYQTYLTQDIVDLADERQLYVEEYLERTTGAMYTLTTPLAAGRENFVCLGLYRNDRRCPFSGSDEQALRHLAPVLHLHARTQLLYYEAFLKQALLDHLIEAHEPNAILLDSRLQVVHITNGARALLAEAFGLEGKGLLPAALRERIQRIDFGGDTIAAPRGPWSLGTGTHRAEITFTAYPLRDHKGRILLFVKAEREDAVHDFSILRRLGLTPQEVNVLAYLPLGYRNEDIARALGIKVVTVKKHLHGAAEKLDARGRTETLARAITLRDDLLKRELRGHLL